MSTRRRCIAEALPGFLITGVAAALMAISSTNARGAAAVYVDAVGLGGSANTTPSAAFSPTYTGSFGDNLWDDRSGFGLNSAGGLTGSRNVIEGGPPETLSTITTTAAVPLGTYRASVYFWSTTIGVWGVKAALSGQTLQTYTPSNSSDTGITDPTQPTIRLYKVLLPGSVTGTSVAVDVNISSGTARTWYDGFSYAAPDVGAFNFDVNENDGGPVSATEPGWVGINDGGATTTTPFSATQNDVTLTVTMPTTGDFDRERTLTNIGGEAQRDLLRDLLFTTSGPIITDLSGLRPSTSYVLRVFSYDADFSNGAVTNWYINSVGAGNLLGSITNVPTNPSGASLDINVMSSATGTIRLLANPGAGGIAYFNGLQVIPEPTALGALSVGLLSIRRNRRR